MIDESARVFDSPEEFFDDLATRDREPLLADAYGNLLIELADGENKQSWALKLSGGDIGVSQEPAETPDCTVRMSRKSFEAALQGEGNILASFLRGSLTVEGDAVLALQFQRLFPGPQSSTTSAQRRHIA